jgi:uncharacterized protein
MLAPPDVWEGPVPAEDLDTAPYWDALRAHRLSILRCRSCELWIHYPVAGCPRCHGSDVAFEPVSGRGEVYTYSVVHREFGNHFGVPWVVAFVELVEQPALRVATNIVGCAPEDVHIGMPVRVTYRDYENGFTFAFFEPAEASAA